MESRDTFLLYQLYTFYLHLDHESRHYIETYKDDPLTLVPLLFQRLPFYTAGVRLFGSQANVTRLAQRSDQNVELFVGRLQTFMNDAYQVASPIDDLDVQKLVQLLLSFGPLLAESSHFESECDSLGVGFLLEPSHWTRSPDTRLSRRALFHSRWNMTLFRRLDILTRDTLLSRSESFASAAVCESEEKPDYFAALSTETNLDDYETGIPVDRRNRRRMPNGLKRLHAEQKIKDYRKQLDLPFSRVFQLVWDRLPSVYNRSSLVHAVNSVCTCSGREYRASTPSTLAQNRLRERPLSLREKTQLKAMTRHPGPTHSIFQRFLKAREKEYVAWDRFLDNTEPHASLVLFPDVLTCGVSLDVIGSHFFVDAGGSLILPPTVPRPGYTPAQEITAFLHEQNTHFLSVWDRTRDATNTTYPGSSLHAAFPLFWVEFESVSLEDLAKKQTPGDVFTETERYAFAHQTTCPEKTRPGATMILMRYCGYVFVQDADQVQSLEHMTHSRFGEGLFRYKSWNGVTSETLDHELDRFLKRPAHRTRFQLRAALRNRERRVREIFFEKSVGPFQKHILDKKRQPLCVRWPSCAHMYDLQRCLSVSGHVRVGSRWVTRPDAFSMV